MQCVYDAVDVQLEHVVNLVGVPDFLKVAALALPCVEDYHIKAAEIPDGITDGVPYLAAVSEVAYVNLCRWRP